MRYLLKSFAVSAFFFLTATARSQVQVREEAFHRPVIENKYLRLLDVWLKPGDTTQFHIHSTPSAFLYYTAARNSAQPWKGTWNTERAKPGKSWYRSFEGDTLVHRVCNADTMLFHVTDMEILQSYRPGAAYQPLPFESLYENEKLAAYRADASSLNGTVIKGRGPLLLQLVEGELAFENQPANEYAILKKGNPLYVRPGTVFSLRPAEHLPVHLVLYELK